MTSKNIKRKIKRYLLILYSAVCIGSFAKNIDSLMTYLTTTSETSELPDNITKDSLLKKLKENETLTKKDKEMVSDFINYIYEYYPECNSFKFYNNLDTLKIEHKDSWNLLFDHYEKTGNYAGTYSIYNNIIKILNEYNNKPTLFHELTHATANTNYNSKHITNRDNNYCYGVEEMFCDYFATRDTNVLDGYPHMDYAEAIIALTGYTYDDYCNKGLSYLEKLLNDNGLNGKEIFKYLNDIRENQELQNDTEYMKQYSINYTKELKNICYKKVIDKFNDSSYIFIEDYIESIRNKIPGDDTDFMNYVSSNRKDISNIRKKYTYEEIKPYIIKNILLESGLVEIGKNIDISEYDLENIDGKLELTYNDSIVELKSVKDKVNYYEDFINRRQVNTNNDNSNNNRCYTVNDRGYLISHLDYNMAIMFEEYFDKVKSYMISKIKKEKNIEEKINLVIGYDNEEQRPCLYYDLDDNSFKIPTKPDGADIYSLYLYLQITDVFDSKFSEKYNLLYDKISENNKKLLRDFPKYNIDNGYQLRK